MPELRRWRGGSGTAYDYWVYSLDIQVRPIYGNYIFARQSPTGEWEAIYVGHGNLARAADLETHYRGELIRSLGATHLCLRENGDETSRLIEQADLLEGNPEAYSPKGCNQPVE